MIHNATFTFTHTTHPPLIYPRTHLHNYPHIYLPTSLIYPPAHSHTHSPPPSRNQPAHLPPYLPTSLPTNLPINLPTSLPPYQQTTNPDPDPHLHLLPSPLLSSPLLLIPIYRPNPPPHPSKTQTQNLIRNHQIFQKTKECASHLSSHPLLHPPLYFFLLPFISPLLRPKAPSFLLLPTFLGPKKQVQCVVTRQLDRFKNYTSECG